MHTQLDGVSNYNATNANSDRGSPGFKNANKMSNSIEQATDSGFANRPRLGNNNPVNPAALSMNFGSKTPGNNLDIFNNRDSNTSGANLLGNDGGSL